MISIIGMTCCFSYCCFTFSYFFLYLVSFKFTKTLHMNELLETNMWTVSQVLFFYLEIRMRAKIFIFSGAELMYHQLNLSCDYSKHWTIQDYFLSLFAFSFSPSQPLSFFFPSWFLSLYFFLLIVVDFHKIANLEEEFKKYISHLNQVYQGAYSPCSNLSAKMTLYLLYICIFSMNIIWDHFFWIVFN